MITVITMYRGHDAETFVAAVTGTLTAEQRLAWREKHDCVEPDPDEDEEDDDRNWMFFRELTPINNNLISDMLNIDSGV